MYSYKKLFTDHLDKMDIKWRDLEEDSLLVTYTAQNVPKVEVTVEFGEDEENRSTATCWTIASGRGKEQKVLELCNTLNSDYRWVKFFMDEDLDIDCQMDAAITPATCGDVTLNAVMRVVTIVDEAYPTIMRALWAN